MRKNLSFAVIGTSALGMPLLSILVRHFRRIKKLFLIDPDTWQTHEAYKHILSTRKHEQKAKVDTANQVIKDYDPSIRVEAIYAKAQSSEAKKVLKKSNVLLSCVDNDTTRLDLQVFAAQHKKIMLDLSAQIIGKERIGTARIYIPNKTPCLVCQGLDLSNVISDTLREARIKTGYLKGTNHNPRSIALLDTATACIGITLLLNHLTGENNAPTTLSLNQNKHNITKLHFTRKTGCKICGNITERS